ncbi:hypothetical protein BC940DRAFT_301732 [Gongronella butleri]|nr:hypothetical protein BC940DRAFT_301732 [Gongronella butleri]
MDNNPVSSLAQPPSPTPTPQDVPVTEPSSVDATSFASASKLVHLSSDEYLEDGPLFRATMRQLEGRTQHLKHDLKRLTKAVMASLQAKQAWLAADEELMRTLQAIPVAKALCASYLDDVWASMHEQRVRLQNSMQALLVDPLVKLYEMDLKVADTKRREFEVESKEFYAYLAKYLSIKKQPSHVPTNTTSTASNASANNAESQLTETKHIFKKRRFDLARFDYYTFMMDLHGGKKEQEVLFHLLTYYQKEHEFYHSASELLDKHRPGIDALSKTLGEVSRAQQQRNKDRIERRNLLQAKYSDDLTMETPPDVPEDKFHGVRDLAERSKTDHVLTDRRKEGFLFSTSKPLKPSGGSGFEMASAMQWHKYWCVLSGGQLHEYSNWKQSMTTHLDPIHLRFATVRAARNMERRFVFEVITPQLRRVYQATSKDEMNAWIQTIQNAIEGVLDGTGTTLDLPKDMHDDDNASIHVESLLDLNAPMSPIPSVSKSKSKRRSFHRRSLSGVLRKHYQAGANNANMPTSNAATTATLPLPTSSSTAIASGTAAAASERDLSLTRLPSTSSSDSFSIKSPNSPPPPLPSPPPLDDIRWSMLSAHTTAPTAGESTSLLDIIRQNDPLNNFCADCGERNPEWCSLNLGLILCIECSGIHRSMGTHVSKIRSLTLDSQAFSADILALLGSLGNGRANAIWEATADVGKKKVSATDRREAKLQYIQQKYVVRLFIQPPTTPEERQSVNGCLFQALLVDDIPAALRAIVLGANVNYSQSVPVTDADTNSENGNDAPSKPAIVFALHAALLYGQRTYSKLGSGQDDAHETSIFPMAEFLLQNGADTSLVDATTGKTVSEWIAMGADNDQYHVSDEAIAFLNLKIAARGQSTVQRASMPPPSKSS